MNVASKIAAYGSAPEAVRRPRRDPAFELAENSPTPQAGDAAHAGGDAARVRSAHAVQSAARHALLEAQSHAFPALERMPAALRSQAAAALGAPRREASSPLPFATPPHRIAAAYQKALQLQD